MPLIYGGSYPSSDPVAQRSHGILVSLVKQQLYDHDRKMFTTPIALKNPRSLQVASELPYRSQSELNRIMRI